MAIRIAGICGSLREASLNKGLLRAAAELAPSGMVIQIFTRLGDIPPYNDDVFVKGDPEPVADMKAFISAADALPIVGDEPYTGFVRALHRAIRSHDRSASAQGASSRRRARRRGPRMPLASRPSPHRAQTVPGRVAFPPAT